MEEYIEDPSFYSSSKQPELSQSKTPNKSLLLRGNFILRQELKSFTPECNAKCGIIFNFALMIAFISIGIPILVSSNQSEEYKFDYTNWYNRNII